MAMAKTILIFDIIFVCVRYNVLIVMTTGFYYYCADVFLSEREHDIFINP